MRPYYISIDGGGSKTEFCLYDCDSGQTQTFLSGSSNYKLSGADAERKVFLHGIQRIFKQINGDETSIRALVMGMSGVDSKKDYDHYMQLALSSGIDSSRIYLCNDSELAFYSKATPPGLCVIAGTGSVSTGIAADRRTARSGGWGNHFSDEGSGSWVGIQILQALLRHCDGYEPLQPIFKTLRIHFGADRFQDLPPILTNIDMRAIAAVAKPVTEAADMGDPYCEKWIKTAGARVAQIGYSVYCKLDFDREKSVDVVPAGSLFKCKTFYESFETSLGKMVIKDNLNFCGEVTHPVLGGIALAKSLFGETDEAHSSIKIAKG